MYVYNLVLIDSNIKPMVLSLIANRRINEPFIDGHCMYAWQRYN